MKRETPGLTAKRLVNVMKQEEAQKPEAATVALDYERVKVVSAVVCLKDVLLTHCHWHAATRAPRLQVEPTSMTYTFALVNATWDFTPNSNLLEIQLEYHLAAFAKLDGKIDGKRDEDTNVPLFQFECDWNVVFEVPDKFEPSNTEALADFAVANGQLVAFPYVRQYVQDMTGRAGGPPLVLPTFRLPAKRPKPLGGRRELKADKHRCFGLSH